VSLCCTCEKKGLLNIAISDTLYAFSRGLKMERNITSFKYGIESSQFSTTQAISRCSTCGEEFKTPLLAMVSSGFIVEEYYACPKCLSKVGNLEQPENLEDDDAVNKEEEALEMKIEDDAEESVACMHHLGYLKRRPKNTPIPEECLTCSKMIDCMSR
jgi:DNA-directed RNA polymerase subunit RPC12/RpoP